MIIGVAGHIGSGKDLIGKIIQYLITKHMVDNVELSSFISIRSDVVWYNELNPCLHCGWQIKKFAYAVKQVASILTGIPVEDFEKEEVKNRLLGEEWIRYGYADGFYRDMNGKPIMNNKQCSKEKYEEEKRINWQTAYKYHYTGRTLMQQIGTEAIRNVIHEDAWVNALMSQYDKPNPYVTVNRTFDKTFDTPILIGHPINKYKRTKFKCSCGNIFISTVYKVETKHTKSCGCYQKYKAAEAQYKNGRVGTRLWNVYNNMIQRCENPKQPRYKDYGGRGIIVADEFKPFEKFKEWAITNGYSDTLTLNRLDNNDIYCSDNCEFTTYSEQTINTRVRKDNTSGYRGVCYEKGMWRASIQINKERKFLGYFNTAKEASDCYEKAFVKRAILYKQSVISDKSWIITDVRFPNEADAIRTRKGIIVRVNRNDYIFNKEGERIIPTKEYQNVMVSDHSSETALDDYTFDYVIDNDGSIEDLITKVKSILLTEKLI